MNILNNKKILIIDDDATTLELVSEFLIEENCMPITARNGEIGLLRLKENQDISAIVLDWMMPEISGIDVLKSIKQNETFRDIPVIMQTGKSDQKSFVEGIEAGAYYYLTKPFKFNLLITVLKKAINESENYKTILNQIKEKKSNIIKYLSKGEIRFKTPKEALEISSWFSQITGNERTSIGLSELLINAVEHGNLAIGFDKKEELLINDTLDLEIEQRLKDQRNKDKYVVIKFERKEENLRIQIEDMGSGFEYAQYLTVNLDRTFDLHGRGIAMSNLIFGNGIQYIDRGNIVQVNIKI